MSLINPKDGWIRFDGTPVQGITPPQVRLRSGTLTPERLAAVSDLYSKFTTAKRLSLAGGGFFAADRRLPDGTIVRMVAINDVDHVHIWAADPVPEEIDGVTFWCIPWDDAWIDEAFTEVFTIPRWLEIGTADGEVEAADFLQDLIRNEKYEPPSDGLYPGNQTWFAPPPHASSGIVVSWWGQMRRYSNSLLDRTIDAAGSWRRAMDPKLVALNSDDIPSAPFAGRTGGIAGALAGQMFHAEGVHDLPPEVTSTPTRTPVAPQSTVWVNGVRYLLPDGVGGPVSSACIGYRAGRAVLRVVRAQTSGSSTIRVLEMDLETSTWNFANNYSIDVAVADLPHPVYTIDVAGNEDEAAFVPSFASQPEIVHPFYWNSDGSEAMGLLYYRTATFTVMGAKGVHVLMKLEATGGGFAVTPMEFSRADDLMPQSTVATSTPGANGGYNSTETTAHDYDYVGVVAADYRGNTPMILRTHINLSETITKTISRARAFAGGATTTWDIAGGGTASLQASTSSSDTRSELHYSGSTTSSATLNGSTISGTSQTRTHASDHVESQVVQQDFVVIRNPDQPAPNEGNSYILVRSVNQIDSDVEDSATATGTVSLWGLSAGDLRGEFVIHAQPLDGEFFADEAHCDISYSYEYHELQDLLVDGDEGSSALANFSKTPRSDLGIILRVSPGGSTTEIGRLVHPRKIDKLGTGSQTWVDGSPDVSTSSGPYGSGPSWTDFTLPSTNSWPAVGNYTNTLQGGRINNHSRNFADFIYPAGAPAHHTNPLATIDGFLPGAVAGAGGYGNTVLSASAMTPDLKVQYTGAVFVAMAAPTALETAITLEIDRWSNEGNEFTPLYPPQPDPDNPGDTMPFPHRGGHAILLDPIFTGPLP